MVLAASGLWLTQESNLGSDVILFKVGLSALTVMLGATPDFVGGKSPTLPDMQIDTLQSEMRWVRPRTIGAPRVLHTLRF